MKSPHRVGWMGGVVVLVLVDILLDVLLLVAVVGSATLYSICGVGSMVPLSPSLSLCVHQRRCCDAGRRYSNSGAERINERTKKGSGVSVN